MELGYCEERVLERPALERWWDRLLDQDARLSAALQFTDGRWRQLAKIVAHSGDAVFWLAGQRLRSCWERPSGKRWRYGWWGPSSARVSWLAG